MNRLLIRTESLIMISLFLMMLLFSWCSQTENSDIIKNKKAESAYPFVKRGDSIVVYWNSPSDNRDSVDYYELFYRTAKDSGWTSLKENIPSVDSPKVTVYRSDIDSKDSIFYFAVRFVAKNGMKSSFHFCYDSTASPPNWFVLWK
jgi:hypothetical protein